MSAVKHTIIHDDHLTHPVVVIDKDGKEVGRFPSVRKAKRHVRDIIRAITQKRHEQRIRMMENG